MDITPSISLINLQHSSIKYISNTDKLTHYTKDIVPGEYQGGFKLWQCTIDMLHYMQQASTIFASKRVIEIGCGHGLLGILARKLGASDVCLQDYNKQVIENLTKPTVQLNSEQGDKFRFIHGDWSHLKCDQEKYDIVLGSQVIYNQQNYAKVLRFVGEFMKESGSCILGNKVYYFGVGGNMSGFRKAVEATGVLHCESLKKISPPTGGNKKEIVRIKY